MKYRILIVEDNIMLAGQQKKRLEKSGYEAEITIDEPGARKLLKKESFDLVLSDVRLPEGDGISLLEWMRKERMREYLYELKHNEHLMTSIVPIGDGATLSVKIKE